MRILCYVNHFFGQNTFFEGKSSLPPGTNKLDLEKRAVKRKEHVETVINQLKEIEGADVKICGIKDKSLVPIDIEFNHIKDRPLCLIYESLNHMAKHVDQYDYFINIEDDVLLPKETFERIFEFDKQFLVNEIFLPNRLEESHTGDLYCVDLKAIPGWTHQQKKVNDRAIKVAINPHSAILILSRQKLHYALKFIDSNFREPFLYNELDSAFAYFHSPFSLYRSVDVKFHYVKHLDNWVYSEGERYYKSVWDQRIRSLRIVDFVPPIVIRLIQYLKRKTE